MSEPIKIIVTAETEAAAAALRTFLQSTGAGLKALAPAAEHGGEALQKLRETAILAREGMHGLELGAMTLAGTKLPELAEAVMGVRLALNGTRTVALLFGVTLSEVLLPLGLIAAGIGAGALIWNSYSEGEKKAAEEAENLAKELEKIPGLINQINTLQKAGLMGPGTAAELAGIANGSIPLYKNSAGEFVRNATERLEVMDSTYGMSPGTGGSHMIDSENTLATTAERNAYVAKLASLNAQQEAVAKLSELEKQASTDRLTGLQKEIAKINEELAKKNEAIETELKIAGLAVSGKQYAAAQQAMADNVAVAQQAIHAAEVKKAEADATAEKKAQAELDKMALGWQKDAEEFLRRVQGEEKAITEQKKKQVELLQIQQALARSAAEAELHKIQSNPFSTDAQKQQQSIPAIQGLMSANQSEINGLTADAGKTSDEAARLQMLTKVNELMQQQVDLQRQLDAAENTNNFGYQLGEVITKLQNVGTLAQQAAQVFGAVWTTAVNSISSSISGLIMGTQTWGQALRSIYNSIVTEIVNQIVHMAVQWLLQHTLMAAISSAFGIGETAKAAATQTSITVINSSGASSRIIIRTGEAAHDAAMTGVQVGTHAAGETAKTGSTLLGAMARGVIRLGETIFHGLQVMIRVAAHFVGEMMMTAIAAVGMAARIPMILAETMAYVIMAAVEALAAIAAIPYVGPFLAPAIAAGILAAGIGLMTGGFAEGGYTGSGGKYDVAGIVHAGEYVMPASAVDRIGVDNLAALHHGSTSSTSPAASGGSGKAVSVYAFTDPRQMADHLQKNDSHEKWVVDVMSRNMHKFR